MEPTEGYCMKCKCKQTMNNTSNVTTKNGREAKKGQCKKCDTNMFVILSKKSGGVQMKSKSKKSKSKKSKSKKSKSKKGKSAKSKSKKSKSAK